MSNSTKIWTIIVVIVIIILGVWIWSANSPQVAPASQTAVLSAPTNTSDSALNQDLSAVDSQLNGLNGDSANIDTSLSPSAQASQ